jgi:hypothetical protein
MGERVSRVLLIAMLMASFIASGSVVGAGLSEVGQAGRAAETYGDWSLETLKNGAAFSLEYKQPIFLPNVAIDTASFAFVCDRQYLSGKVGALLIPFNEGYNNQQEEVLVFIGRSSEQGANTPLMQTWSNGYKYIFLNRTEDVERLVDYLRTSQTDGVKSVNVIFSGDPNGRSERILTILVGLSNFSDGFSHFETACAVPWE